MLKQIIGTTVIQTIAWYVLYFGGVTWFADYGLMAINVLTMIYIVFAAWGLHLINDADFIIALVKSGKERVDHLSCILAMIHSLVLAVLMASHGWLFGSLVWGFVLTSNYVFWTRQKRMLIPDKIKLAKYVIEEADRILIEQAVLNFRNAVLDAIDRMNSDKDLTAEEARKLDENIHKDIEEEYNEDNSRNSDKLD